MFAIKCHVTWALRCNWKIAQLNNANWIIVYITKGPSAIVKRCASA